MMSTIASTRAHFVKVNFVYRHSCERLLQLHRASERSRMQSSSLAGRSENVQLSRVSQAGFVHAGVHANVSRSLRVPAHGNASRAFVLTAFVLMFVRMFRGTLVLTAFVLMVV